LGDLTKGNKVPKQSFTIKNTGQVVEIERNLFWRNIVVRLEGREIGKFKNLSPLKQGEFLKTPIGDIYIQYKQSLLTSGGFEVSYDNAPLIGSLNDPARHWRHGYQTALFLGVFNIAIGGIAISSKDSLLASIGAGPYSVVFGVVLLLLGLWSWRRHSGTALAFAAFIFAADGALGLFFLLKAGVSPNVFGLMVRAAFVLGMWGGAQAAWNIEPEEPEKAKNSY
jgi:hypothetical protein